MLNQNIPKIRDATQSASGQTDQAQAKLSTDTRRPARLGLWVLGLGFGGFLLWSALAPLDEGVPTSGAVSIDTKRKSVQHLSGGIISEVHVKEGQFVKAHTPLLKVDTAIAQANFESIRLHYLTVRAMEGRLLAEQSNQNRIDFHPDLKQAADNTQLKEILANQRSLFDSRRNALKADADASQEGIRGLEASIQGFQGLLSSRKSQMESIKEELNGIRDLVKEGYVARNKQLEIERMLADVSGSIADYQSNILRARQSILEAQTRIRQRKEEYRKEVDSQLAEIRREVQADAEKLKAATDELARTTIRAPVDGQVVGLAVQTVGGVITPGQKLMDIVPQDETLLLETRIPPHLIDRVEPGKLTDVRFSAFAHSPALVVEGRVDSISTDLILDPANNTSYYLARISLTPEGLKTLGNRQMQAGMPAEVIIKTGERTVLEYILHPLLKRIAATMKEE